MAQRHGSPHNTEDWYCSECTLILRRWPRWRQATGTQVPLPICCSPRTMDPISVTPRKGYAPRWFIYGNHAGTIVGNGVGRTPSKSASNLPWCHIRGHASFTAPILDSQRKVGVVHGTLTQLFLVKILHGRCFEDFDQRREFREDRPL